MAEQQPNGSPSNSNSHGTPKPTTNLKKSGTNNNSIVSRYRTTLTSLSARTGTALPALITSFAVLHEVTAIVPLVGVFYACRTFGVGEGVVRHAREVTVRNAKNAQGEEGVGWVTRTSERWMKEGEAWTERVGRRYGIWGFEKGSKPRPRVHESDSTTTGNVIAGDVANALVAYCATKALLPARIGLSLYFAPAFARSVVSPLGRGIAGVIRGSRSGK
ncbi:uncharacterized protein FOMMEDRAFT_80580 [Fomitiporia mediterranea MF3/22]|uniref:uncharacterized protein n=1 Tax=Fomitiporia mediterranea (strain MF3/22) TaxID=694068 RepID=UPI0004408D89|nr:uncharacterized protein FOMMEDRAFT_80580 [Fomitiporia mediterranea MF3/22]EJD05250.1 hypothetical protein FOMMEDRAFT_80580 [Fomitiporia mediterranea MF3/22]